MGGWPAAPRFDHNCGQKVTGLSAILGTMTAKRRPNEPEVFVLADRALESVVAAIGPEQWPMEVPEWFATRAGGDHRPTLREVIQYHAYDDAWVPEMLAGRTMDEAGRDRFDGDLLGADPAASFATLVDRACHAAGAVDDLDRPVHTSFGDFATREYFWQINSFRGLRAHDIARIVGVEADLPDDLVEGLWAELEPHAAAWRELGVFDPEVVVAGDAPLLDRLLGLTGRQPRPSAP